MDRRLSRKGLEEDVKYFLSKRNKSLDMFLLAFENNLPLEKIEERYQRLLKRHKQYLLIDDALVIFRLAKNKK